VGVEDTKSAMPRDDMRSSSDSSKEPEDDFDLDYDPLWDHYDNSASIFLDRSLFGAHVG